MESQNPIRTKIIAYLDGELGQEGVKELSDWISDSKENARYYSEIKDLWEASVSDASKIADTENEWKKFVSRAKKVNRKMRKGRNIEWKTIARIAAVLMIGIFIGSLLIPDFSKTEPVYCTAIAPEGSVSKLILPDSTLICLNAGSEIRYSVDPHAGQREVFLQGEAWFSVSHAKNRPFVVHTSFYEVNVLGTEFNVKAYDADSRVETTLEKGIVRVNSSGKFRLPEDIYLKPGEQLVFNKETNELRIKSVNTRLFTSWKDNKLEFIKMSLNELIVLLERRYGIDIDVENPEILKFHYSGTIKNESVLEIMEVIEHTLPIRYEIKGQTIKIYKN